MDNFANAPASITEIRSDKTGKAEDWTPRDALIATLRAVDSGELKIKQTVMVYTTELPCGHDKTISRCAGKATTFECMGILSHAQWQMSNEGG